MSGYIVGSIDVAELALIAFALFFTMLIFWLRREDRREGYPLEDEMTGAIETAGGPMHTASTKSFRLPFGKGTVSRRGGPRTSAAHPIIRPEIPSSQA